MTKNKYIYLFNNKPYSSLLKAHKAVAKALGVDMNILQASYSVKTPEATLTYFYKDSKTIQQKIIH